MFRERVAGGNSSVLGCVFFFQAEDGIRDSSVTGVQTCALPISRGRGPSGRALALREVSLPDAVARVARAPDRIVHLIDGVDGGTTGPVSRAAAARAIAWCVYLQGHARRLYASVTDMARVAAALLAAKLTHGRLPSPFTAREVYRNEWTGLTETRVVQGALECLEDLGWLRRGGGPAPARGRGRGRVRLHPRAARGAGR